jgi:hypothetical protein
MSDTNDRESLLAEAAAIRNDPIGWRRRIHAAPEMGYREHATAELVATSLRDTGLGVRTGWAREETLRELLARLAIRVETVLEYQGMEVRGNAERVAKGPMGDHGGGREVLGGCGGVELGDQREDKLRDLTEEALIAPEEHPQGLRHGEDEP